tara:strand:- start:491 stop:2143 length:1653 start_codon:yes stop_codon:yes gene_type:complete
MAVQMFSPKKLTLYFTAVLILSAIFLSTCSETSEYGEASDYEKLGAVDTISPIISSISPTDNSSDVTVSTTIAVTFNEKISTSTATTNTSDTTCSGSFQLSSDNFSSCIKMSATPSVSNDDKTFTLTPADNLSGRVTYQLKLTTSVKDANGVALETYTTNGFITYYDRFTSGSGIISGAIIRDNGSALSDVDAKYDIGEYTKTVNSDNDGDYGIYALTAGSYTLTYSKSGFQETTQSATLASDTDNITVATLTMCPSGSSGGHISGQIRDAVSSDNVSGVLVSLREGLNTRSGSTISGKTATTEDNGTYTISNVDAGTYTAEASKDDWITSYFNISSCNGATNQDANMSKTLPDGAMRIVLTWRGTEDFDSHLEIPCTSGTCSGSGLGTAENRADKSHLWYSVNQSSTITFSGASDARTQDYHIYTDIVSSATNSSGDYVTLDQDNTDGVVATCSSGSCGPETITISKLRSGTYRYHVHVWSQKGNGNSTSHLADNGTYVQVFYENESFNFDVPNRTGDLWTVFDFTLSDNFTSLNIMDSELTPGNVDNH